ncbi:MAG: SRPBCC family protein [Acidimicrobiales bacterium]
MTDQQQQRSIDLSVEVPGTPEEVWETIATGPGISSWFVPHDVAEYEGGEVIMDFGTYGKETARVVAWEPPRRVVFSSGGEHPLAYEWLVEASAGGTCVVRLVNSGFGYGEEWDDQFAGMSEGWKLFLQNLRMHLTHFRGQRARAVIPVGSMPGPNDAAFSALCDALGVRPDLRPRDRFATAGAGVPELAGTVDEIIRQPAATAYLLLLDAPAPGTALVAAEGDGDKVTVSTYLYLYGDAAEKLEDAWTPFFAERFAALTP